jgi:hypothetical protein
MRVLMAVGSSAAERVLTLALSASSSMTRTGASINPPAPGVELGEPSLQVLQDLLVLLYDDEDGDFEAVQAEPERVQERFLKIVLARREHASVFSSIDQADADGCAAADLTEFARAIKADEPLIESLLGLAAQTLQGAGQENNQAVSDVACFAAECGVRRGFAGLYVTHDEPPALPRRGLRGIPDQIEDVVGHTVKRGHDSWPVLLLRKLVEAPKQNGSMPDLSAPSTVRTPGECDLRTHLDRQFCVQLAKQCVELIIGNRKHRAQPCSEVHDLPFFRLAIIGERYDDGSLQESEIVTGHE